MSSEQDNHHSWVTASPEYLSFGGGRNACPGRFFASSELKIMLGHILLNYDFVIHHERPRNIWFATNHLLATEATVKVRRRQTGGWIWTSLLGLVGVGLTDSAANAKEQVTNFNAHAGSNLDSAQKVFGLLPGMAGYTCDPFCLTAWTRGTHSKRFPQVPSQFYKQEGYGPDK